MNMKTTPRRIVYQIATVSLSLLISNAAFAQSATAPNPIQTYTQRDINQQQRIENGLKDGSLNTREAARLERREARIERLEVDAAKDGNVSKQEAERISRAQNGASREIFQERHDAQQGNPKSASSERMQADVQRNINQESRIQQGVQSGSLTNRESAALERGQARVASAEARAGRDGHVGPHEQAHVQRMENNQSARIFNRKHN
jgi:hypothetical protein